MPKWCPWATHRGLSTANAIGAQQEMVSMRAPRYYPFPTSQERPHRTFQPDSVPDGERGKRSLASSRLCRGCQGGAVPVLVLAVALFFVFPWLPEPSPAGATLERYSPEYDGGSLLIENYDADGALVSTESQNLATITDLRMFSESSQAMRDELEKIYGSHENMEDAQVVGSGPHRPDMGRRVLRAPVLRGRPAVHRDR